MTEYQSFKYKATHFHLQNIKDLLISNLDVNLQTYQLQSDLSSEKLKTTCSELKSSKTYLFDKMYCQSKELENVSYVSVASIDSNMTFIDSFDSQMLISNSELTNLFLNKLQDTNSVVYNLTNTSEKYTLFDYNNSTYIGMLFPIANHYSIVVITETFSDDSVSIESTDLNTIDINYGFEHLEENEILLGNVQNPNDNFFEYAS